MIGKEILRNEKVALVIVIFLVTILSVLFWNPFPNSEVVYSTAIVSATPSPSPSPISFTDGDNGLDYETPSYIVLYADESCSAFPFVLVDLCLDTDTLHEHFTGNAAGETCAKDACCVRRGTSNVRCSTYCEGKSLAGRCETKEVYAPEDGNNHDAAYCYCWNGL